MTNATDIVQQIRTDVFNETGIKIDNDDPVISLILITNKITTQHLEYVINNLESTADNITDNLLQQQNKVNTDFDVKLGELSTLLAKLEKQKELIVADVWAKLNTKITEQIQQQLTKDIRLIANQENNRINNQRIMLIGAMAGLSVGLIALIVIVFFTT